MAQQRARVLAMRARKLAEKQAAEAAKKLAAKASTTKGPLKDGNKYAPTLREYRDSKTGPVADRQEYGKTLKENKASKQGPVRDAKEYANNTLSQNKTRPSTKAQPSTSTKTGGNSPVQRAVAATKSRVPQRFADGAKGGKYDKAVKNKETAKSNFFRSSSGTRGENVSSNPKLKSKPTKPRRSSFPAGRAGAAEYAAALARYRKLSARVPEVRRKTNRRGQAI